MIRKIPKKLTPYEKYFMTEAPARRPYMRIISAFPDGRLKRFDDNIEDPDPDTPEPEEEPANAEDLDLVDDTDFNDNMTDDEDTAEPEAQNVPAPAEGLETEPPADTEAPAPVETDAGAETGTEPTVQTDEPAPTTEPADNPPPVEGGDAPADDTGGGLETEPPAGAEGDAAPTDDTGGEAPAEGEGGEGGLDTEDNTDFGANMDDGGGDVEGGEAPADDGGGGEGTAAPPNNAENQLKFSLYRNLKNLYIAVQNYISQLDDMTVSSYNYNMVIKTASRKLGELEDYMYEYMTIRFKDAPYIESMEFYQKCITTLQLIFELLRNNKENGNSKDKTIN